MTLENTYAPPPFWKSTPMKSMAIAVLGFFQYDMYCGSAASIFWALNVYRSSNGMPLTHKQGISMSLKLVGLGLLAGPSAVVVYLIWRQDGDNGLIGFDQGKED